MASKTSKTIATHPAGAFTWPELATSDPKAAARFYAALFGWDVQVVKTGPNDYTLFKLDGDDVAASYQMGTDEGPPHWNCYVSVASADDAAARARSLGGSVVGKGPFDVEDIGRMATLRDPAGAMFMVWQPKSHSGAKRLNEPGALCWTELATTDTTASEKFYTSLFGWTAKKGTQAPGEYTEFFNRGEAIAGMLRIQPEWGNVPPHWMPYFAVVDCDAAAASAKHHGGALHVPPTDIPGVGRFAVVRDPQGAVFAIIALRQAA
jgi:predicted enzyme related to lactoylglutathione lyase